MVKPIAVLIEKLEVSGQDHLEWETWKPLGTVVSGLVGLWSAFALLELTELQLVEVVAVVVSLPAAYDVDKA